MCRIAAVQACGMCMASLALEDLTLRAQARALFVGADIWEVVAVACHSRGGLDWALMTAAAASAAGAVQKGLHAVLLASRVHRGPVGWPRARFALAWLPGLAFGLTLALPFAWALRLPGRRGRVLCLWI